jgi:transcriptional regulator with XRE-family HTH domain
LGREAGVGEGWLQVVLALRLRQLSAGYGTLDDFAAKCGVSRGTLSALRSGHGNATLQTLETLARNLGISVWSLLGIQDDVVRGSLERFGLEYCEIEAHLIARAAAQKDLDTFSGVPPSERNHSRRSGEPSDLQKSSASLRVIEIYVRRPVPHQLEFSIERRDRRAIGNNLEVVILMLEA